MKTAIVLFGWADFFKETHAKRNIEAAIGNVFVSCLANVRCVESKAQALYGAFCPYGD